MDTQLFQNTTGSRKNPGYSATAGASPGSGELLALDPQPSSLFPRPDSALSPGQPPFFPPRMLVVLADAGPAGTPRLAVAVMNSFPWPSR